MIDPLTKLEDHPTGGNVNAIVQSNWQTLKKWVDPALSAADDLFTLLVRGIYKVDAGALPADQTLPQWDATAKKMKQATIIKLPTYSVATLPAANTNIDALVFCTDGDSGAKCLAVSDGITWKRVVLGAEVST